MLELTIPETEIWDDESEEFIGVEETTLRLEHSLASISKWESKWHKPFLYTEKMSSDEIISYIKCMTTNVVNQEVYNFLDNDTIQFIFDNYVGASMTATTFSSYGQHGRTGDNEIKTAEVIYYYMFKCGIPIECEHWHLNRLLTLIRVFNEKEAPQKPMSESEIIARNQMLNKARRAKLNSKG